MIATAESPMPTELDFTDIYSEHYRRVFNLCAYLLNSGDTAEDAAQEVFMRVQRKIDTYNPEFSLSNWILKIASNYCVDLLRKRGKEKRLFVPDTSESLDPSSDKPSPLRNILTSEKGKRVRCAIASLDEKFRTPLILAFYNDFTYDEIAESMGIPRNTVATLLFRGKQQLREKLKKENYHDLPR
jgi:RNA polymerase sigma-70 factor (ECF subfamily)